MRIRDPESFRLWIRDRKIRVRDKHPGSATLGCEGYRILYMSWRRVGGAGSSYEKNTPVIRHEKLKTAQTDVLCEVVVQGGAGIPVQCRICALFERTCSQLHRVIFMQTPDF